MQDTDSKSPGNTLTASEWNEGINEILNVILALGQSLSSGDLDQLGKSIAGYAGAGDFYIESGAADAYVASPFGLKEGPTQYEEGLMVRFRAGNANTGASTINVNALGVKDITQESGAVLSAADIGTTSDAILRYDDTAGDFFLMDWALPFIANTLKQGDIDGFLHNNNGADADHDIDVGVGICRDDADTTDINATTGLTKQIDANFALGTNAGGFPSGLTLSADTDYRFFVIAKTDGSTDFGWDTSATAANLLIDANVVDGPGWGPFLQIKWDKTDASSNIIPYIQNTDDLDEITWDVPAMEVTDAASPTTATLQELQVPPNTTARYRVTAFTASSLLFYALFTDTRQTDTTPSVTVSNLRGRTDGDINFVNLDFMTQVDSASEIRVRFSTTVVSYSLNTLGYRYRRGKL